jgi:hypothetical protein
MGTSKFVDSGVAFPFEVPGRYLPLAMQELQMGDTRPFEGESSAKTIDAWLPGLAHPRTVLNEIGAKPQRQKMVSMGDLLGGHFLSRARRGMKRRDADPGPTTTYGRTNGPRINSAPQKRCAASEEGKSPHAEASQLASLWSEPISFS